MGRKKKEEEDLPITEIGEDVLPSDVEEDLFDEDLYDLYDDYEFDEEEIEDEDEEE